MIHVPRAESRACRILAAIMPQLPTGTVTFLFSDIEGSTALLKRLGDASYAELLATHRQLIRETFAGFGGQEIDTQGDAFFYSFPRARDAVAAAVAVQRAHTRARWPGDAAVRLRIGLHTGEPAVGEEGYTGLDVVRASRLAAIGRGGQVLLSDTTRAIVADDLPEGVSLRSLGEQPLRDIERPEPLSELIISDVSVTAPSTDRPEALGDNPPARSSDTTPDLPEWILGSARRFIPGGEKTRDLIEQRVLESITKAFEDGNRRRSRRRDRDVDPPEPPKPSMADEIDRLRSLRDSGALTEEQYARAVDRVVGAGPDEPA
jgi:class 3 adenylate cyclase